MSGTHQSGQTVLIGGVHVGAGERGSCLNVEGNAICTRSTVQASQHSRALRSGLWDSERAARVARSSGGEEVAVESVVALRLAQHGSEGPASEGDA